MSKIRQCEEATSKVVEAEIVEETVEAPKKKKRK